MIRTRVVGDLSELPTSAFGLRSLIFWGVVGFMVVEGTAFLLAAGAYLYLVEHSATWPPEPFVPPRLLFGTLFTVLLVLTEVPNRWLGRKAREKQEGPVKWGLTLMCALGLVLVLIRAFEFTTLNVRWDQNAYGSATWLLIVLHAAHLITDLTDSIVVAVWLFTHGIGDDQFSDVNDNCAYWSFVVWTWIPVYALIYWAPRLL
jgi:cytochrome c oxidase subunit III